MTEPEYNVIIDKPPVWDSVCKAFGIIPKQVLFTYGDIIYNPDDVKIPDDILLHETVHMEQQKRTIDGVQMTPELWWGKYLREPNFRVAMEAEAYAMQYRFVCQRLKGRNQRFNFRIMLARILSGPLYNNAIDTAGAEKLIYTLSGVK